MLKGVKPVRMKDAQSGEMVDSYWAASQKMLVDEDFLPSLRYCTELSSNPRTTAAVVLLPPARLSPTCGIQAVAQRPNVCYFWLHVLQEL